MVDLSCNSGEVWSGSVLKLHGPVALSGKDGCSTFGEAGRVTGDPEDSYGNYRHYCIDATQRV